MPVVENDTVMGNAVTAVITVGMGRISRQYRGDGTECTVLPR